MSGIIPKQWSVSTISTAKDPLRIYCGGKPLTQSAHATIDGVSPVEYLLISAATCFALSCRAALIPRDLSETTFEVTAVGTKASDAPSRLQVIEVSVKFANDMPPALAARIADEAKSMCTVTNTILGTPDVTVAVTARTEPEPS